MFTQFHTSLHNITNIVSSWILLIKSPVAQHLEILIVLMMKKLKQIVLLTTNANAIVWMHSQGFIESTSCLLSRWWARYNCTNGCMVGISVLPPPQQFSETVLKCLHYNNINKLCLRYMQVPDSSHLIQALQVSFL